MACAICYLRTTPVIVRLRSQYVPVALQGARFAPRCIVTTLRLQTTQSRTGQPQVLPIAGELCRTSQACFGWEIAAGANAQIRLTKCKKAGFSDGFDFDSIRLLHSSNSNPGHLQLSSVIRDEGRLDWNPENFYEIGYFSHICVACCWHRRCFRS